MTGDIIGQTMKGRDKSVLVERDALVLTYSKAFHGFKGDKRIPYKRITALQFREPGFLLAGYIQFSIQGAVEWHGPIVQDENAVLFEKSETAQFKALRNFIDEAMARAEGTTPAPASVADELAKLADLRSQGVLTEDEFAAQKARLKPGFQYEKDVRRRLDELGAFRVRQRGHQLRPRCRVPLAAG